MDLVTLACQDFVLHATDSNRTLFFFEYPNIYEFSTKFQMKKELVTCIFIELISKQCVNIDQTLSFRMLFSITFNAVKWLAYSKVVF